MLLAGGTEEMTFKTSGATINEDLVAILPNGQKCSPNMETVADSMGVNGYCDNCLGASYASKKGRWIFRCGGKNLNDNCKKKKPALYLKIHNYK